MENTHCADIHCADTHCADIHCADIHCGITNLIDKFNARTDTHPNIAALWISYLELKKKALAELLEQGERAYTQLDTFPDFSQNNLRLFTALKLSMELQ